MTTYLWSSVGGFSVYSAGNTIPAVNWNQWTNGGTFITNFSVDKFSLYEQAVEIYAKRSGDTQLFIADKCSPVGYSNGGSLHRKSRPSDLSAFWDIYHRLQKGESLDDSKQDDTTSAYDRAMGIVGK